MPTTSVMPAAWKVEAASTRIDALTKIASVSATTMSMVANRSASRLPGVGALEARVCTIEECR